jgi:NAD(P)-dependent dehydrogenase (short-subunit alcohol dehydrogenase family)
MNQFSSSLQGKVGILTGGTSGFGFEIVKALKSEGANVAVFSVDQLPDQSRQELEAISGGKTRYWDKDILAHNASEEMVQQTVDEFKTLDFVVVNAGLAIRFEEPLFETPIDHIAKSMVNQFEMFAVAFTTLSLAAAKVMAPKYENLPFSGTGHRHDSGSIVVTLSEASLCPARDDLLAYGTAKRATMWAMRTLAAVLGPKNIRVNGIAPGFANTAGPKKFYDRYPQIKADIERKNHLQPSFMHPGSVVPAVLYLLSDNYVTGETVALDGGFNIQLTSYFQEES